MFSIEQITTQLSLRSRITSSSYSFQPTIDVSINISEIGLAARPLATTVANSFGVLAMPVPRPPKIYAGRIITGKPISARTKSACSAVCAMPLRGTFKPISIIASLNLPRSSAVAIAKAFAPINSGVPGTPTLPRSNNAIAKLSAVCPPSVANTASGRSRSIICRMNSGVSGSI